MNALDEARRKRASTTASPTTPAPPWPDPVPLAGQPDTPSFPVDVLPDWAGAYVTAQAEELQVPVDLPAMLVLGAAAAGIARKVVVSPWSGWDREPTNLFAGCFLPPGERKSQTFSTVFAPVMALEQDLRQQEEPRVKEAESEYRVKQKRVDHLETRIAKCDDVTERVNLQGELKKAREELQAVIVPALPVLRVDDDTPEMMALELVKQRGRLLAASPEARTLENISRYSDTPNMDVFLKGHAGDDIRSGRVGRGRDTVDRPALTCAFTPQPCVLDGLGETDELRGRGFLARWFYSLPASGVGYRKVRAAPVPRDVRQRYVTQMTCLWLIGYADPGAELAHELRFTSDAVAVLEEFEKWKEELLRPGGTLAGLAGWGNKLGGLCVRLCGILHAMDGIPKGDPWKTSPISSQVVKRAVRLCRQYAVPHAVAAFDRMGVSEAVANARGLMKWVGNRAEPTAAFSKRDAFNGCRGTFDTVAEMEPSLDLLEQHYLIRPKGAEPRTGPGRKSSPVYEVNPAAFAKAAAAHNTQKTHNTGSLDGAGHSAESAISASAKVILK